ncbi:hypothetical protein FQR65_LT03830 [Abscondita terminalis]|nr:hypothetical protein FQR65_LT03830 [Abscondita terminalis]
MGKRLDKLLLLTWKNVLIQWRHPIQSVVQIITPILFSFLLVVIRSLVVPEPHEETHFKPFENNLILNKTFARAIAYSPSSPVAKQIMNDAVTRIYKKSKTKLKLISCNDSVALEQYLMDEFHMILTVAGVQFDDSLLNQTTLNEKTSITFRFPAELRMGKGNWRTKFVYPLYQVPGPRSWTENEGGPPNYYAEGFLILQQEISLSVINYFKPFETNISLYMQRFPYPEFVEDNLLTALQSFVGLIFMLSFVYTCISTVKIITTEKELQLKEVMKIMGLPNWLHCTAWFIKSFVMLFVSIILMVLIVKISWYPNTDNTVFTYSNPLVLLLFLVFYITAVITFCFAISVFFSKATTASTVASIVWFLSFFPYSYMQKNYADTTLSQKLWASLGVNSAMAFGFQLIIMFEGAEEGIQWHNIWDTISPDEDLTLGHLMVMLAVDSLIYLLIALYVEAIFPGSFGVPKVWYFPFTMSYWCGVPTDLEVEEQENLIVKENEFIEDDPSDLEIGIKIQHLGKRFSGNKAAVKDLSLNVYKDQITVLLGHNGAGKTSTMNMLTGMFPPSKGTAIIGGFSSAEINQEIENYISDLDLVPKRNSPASQLSGGMKRKLSIGVALCGGSKVVMCDEPTSGMDPAARKILSDLLQSQRKGRTILLTTHYMDEADILGDRIAIMANGNLQCYGTSFFLKKKYGAGYRLVMEKSRTCNVKEITNLLQNHISDVQFSSDIGSELTYKLSPEHSSIFQPMLEELETNSERLGILSYGISLTNLEEVFTRFGSDTVDSGKDVEITVNQKELNFSYCQGEGASRSMFFNQLIAMLMKRGLSVIRSWLLFFIQNFMVVFFLIIAVILARRTNINNHLPDMAITLNSYLNPVTLVTEVGDNPYAESFKNLINREKHILVDWKDQNMSSMIINQTIENPTGVRKRFISGATFNNDSITGWFSNQPYHASPLCLQLLMNAVLQKEISTNHSIEFRHYPLPFQLDTRLKNLIRGTNFGFQIALNLGFSMAFVSAFYVMFYIKERSCKAKHMQYVSGVSVLPFWIASFICDILTFIFTSSLILYTLLVFHEDGFSSFAELGRIFFVLLLLGYSVLPSMYIASYFFDIPSTGFTRISLMNIFSGMTAMLVVQILAQPEINLQHVADTMHWFLLLVPHYSFSTGVRDLFVVYSTQENCNVFIEKCVNFTIPGFPHLTPEQCRQKICKVVPKCCDTTTNYFDLEAPGIGRNIIFSLCVGTFLIVVLLLTEYRVWEKITGRIFLKKYPLISARDLDNDVQDENERVRRMVSADTRNNTMIMKDVTKYYKNFLAVNNICLAVNKHECFGLLGINGAGKTTTFKIMTGDIKMSFGEAWVNGINLNCDMKKVHQCIGYCPQFDGLLEDLTCYETLVIFSMLRAFLQEIKELSGGNKRKLSTALALIGNPLVLFLDEPTSGMDPVTKRFIWNVLNKVRDSGKCVILTSHSMEECEALCTRSAIMVNGEFMCLGSTQHLKNKFSDGYTLTIKTKQSRNLIAVEDFVKENFNDVIIREKHQDIINFYIKDKSRPWSQMFGIMERAKHLLDIEDYSLGQSSLEQVFLSFTKYQKEENV